MKKLLLSLTLVMSILTLSAQNFIVREGNGLGTPGNIVENGATFFVYGDGSASGYTGAELKIDFTVTATTNIRIIGEKNEGEIVENSSNYFCCFGNCWSSTVYVTEPFMLNEGQSTDFSAHYSADEQNGYTYLDILDEKQIMTYYIYEANSSSPKFEITVVFMYSLEGVEDFTSPVVFSEAYPIPAGSVVNFDYNFPASTNDAMLVIYNMMGQEVTRNELNGLSGKANIDVSNMNDGIYFYSLVINGKTEKSSKIVIRK